MHQWCKFDYGAACIVESWGMGALSFDLPIGACFGKSEKRQKSMKS